jgi:hypothetical protein
MSRVQERVAFLTYALLIRSERVIGYSWEGVNPTIRDIGK